MRIWRPGRAAVLGVGSIGLLAAMALSLRGLKVCAFGRTSTHFLNADLVAQIGGCYHSTDDVTLTEFSGEHGPFDIIFEATGHSPIAFEAMNILGSNGVLILSSVLDLDGAAGRLQRRQSLRLDRGRHRLPLGTVARRGEPSGARHARRRSARRQHREVRREGGKDKNDPFRLMGFGHRVYKHYDPRAKIMQRPATRC